MKPVYCKALLAVLAALAGAGAMIFPQYAPILHGLSGLLVGSGFVPQPGAIKAP